MTAPDDLAPDAPVAPSPEPVDPGQRRRCLWTLAIVILRTSRRLGSIWWAIALGGLLGGLLGNLIDRLTRPPSFGLGYVVDFIQVPNFAVFNIADMFITCSAVLMVILALRGIEITGARS